MITREEAIRRLEDISGDIAEIKQAIEQGWNEATSKDTTQDFLDKCRGWEDTRSPQEIIADIYNARTSSNRGANTFSREP